MKDLIKWFNFLAIKFYLIWKLDPKIDWHTRVPTILCSASYVRWPRGIARHTPPPLLNAGHARQDKTMSVYGLRCILYARIYIPYMHTILYYYVQTGRPPVPISSELK